MVTKHIYLSGKVQGVSFRFHAHERARDLKIRGFVRNLEDGRVEVVAHGSTEHIAKFVEWLRKGPPAAHVEKVEMFDVDHVPKAEFFYIRRDGGPTWQE